KALFTSIKESTEIWAPLDLYNLFGFLFNQFHYLLSRQDAESYFTQIRDLLIWGVETNVLHLDGVLPPASYRNLIIFCIRTQAFDLAERYLKQLKSQLPLGLRNETFTICKAMILIEQQAYPKVLKLLGVARFRAESFEVSGRWLSLQAHHERYPEDAEWRLRQAERHLRYVKSRSTLNPTFRMAYQNQFRLYKRILTSHHPSQKERVLAEIKQTHPLHNKRWLLKLAAPMTESQ
ncbi:MAG: hypothetical protein AAFR59_18650, partial [Bacteroidota bacterium]